MTKLISNMLVLGAEALSAICGVSAQAAVTAQNDGGFAIAHTARVAAIPADVWNVLRAPDKWWSGNHSWSGDAANLWLDAQAGGCFCEKLPGSSLGSVEHARVVYVEPAQTLRLSGALGPLQGEAVTGTLTIQLKAIPEGTAIRFDYVVGGFARLPLGELAPLVDRVIAAQIAGLAGKLGGALPLPDAEARGPDPSATGAAADEPGDAEPSG